MPELIIDQGLLTWVIGFFTMLIGGLIAYFFNEARVRAKDSAGNLAFQKQVAEAITALKNESAENAKRTNNLAEKFFAHLLVSQDYMTRLKYLERDLSRDDEEDRRPVRPNR
jgi:hypothetical protein